jgi:hypothetical protein
MRGHGRTSTGGARHAFVYGGWKRVEHFRNLPPLEEGDFLSRIFRQLWLGQKSADKNRLPAWGETLEMQEFLEMASAERIP